jgi:ribosomal protein L18
MTKFAKTKHDRSLETLMRDRADLKQELERLSCAVYSTEMDITAQLIEDKAFHMLKVNWSRLERETHTQRSGGKDRKATRTTI